MTPLVSILIPVFNAAPWLGQTLSSVLSQTYPHMEIIVVDDGSTDDSASIARTFESRGVRVVTQSNRGASAARNHAFRLARGEYIQFLDADDILDAKKISLQMQRLQSAGPLALASAEWARFRLSPDETAFHCEPNWIDLSGVDFLVLHFREGWMMPPAAWLAPRTLFDAVGPWDETLSLNDDGEYFARTMLRSSGILFCPGARCHYRSEIAGSLSSRKDATALDSLWRASSASIEAMLKAEDSPRTRGAAAYGWKRLAYDLHPGAPDLVKLALARCATLGGVGHWLPASGRIRWSARLIGWRLAKQLFS